MISKILKIILPILLIIVMVFLFNLMKTYRPQSPVRTPPPQIIKVNTQKLKPTNQQIVINSQGFIEPTYRTILNAELAAKVIWVSPKFEAGEYLKQGEQLIRFDARDVKSEFQQANAALINAEVSLTTEQNRAELALQEWQLMQDDIDNILVPKPSDLTLRKPQLKAAKANVVAQKARLNRAQMLVERSVLSAPYNGYVIARNVSPGQTVSNGYRLGEIISADSLQLRLPIGISEVSLIKPPNNSDNSKNISKNKYRVEWEFENQKWSAPISRIAKEADAQTRKIDVIVDINPKLEKFHKLQSGVFISAKIYGRTYQNIYRIPRIVVNKAGLVPFAQDNQIVWKQLEFVGNDGNNFWVENGISSDDLLITSNVQIFPNGTKINQNYSESSKPRKRKK